MGLKIDVNRFEFAILAETAKLTRVPVVATYSHYGERPADQRVAFREAEDEADDTATPRRRDKSDPLSERHFRPTGRGESAVRSVSGGGWWLQGRRAGP